jgi:hypothetical protein
MNARGRDLRRVWRYDQDELLQDLEAYYELMDSTSEYLGINNRGLDRSVQHQLARFFLNGEINNVNDLLQNNPNNAENNIYGNNQISIKEPRNIPENATETITLGPIASGELMANFHNEFLHKRYYTKNSFNKLKKNPDSGKKQNPVTRKNINPENVVFYRKKGGKRNARKTKRRHGR